MAVRPVSLARALSNLIDNALRYGGQARVSLIRDGAEVVFRVEDASVVGDLKPGDKVRFRAEQISGAYHVQRIEKSP